MKINLTPLLLIALPLVLVSCGSFRSKKLTNDSSNQARSQAGAPAPTGNIERDAINNLNRFRATQGLPPVQSHPGLASLSRTHSNYMRKKNKLNHLGLSQRASVAQQKYQIGSIAENVQRSWGSAPSGASIVRQWENSSAHRANMKGNFDYAGIGVSQAGDSIYSTLLLGKGGGSSTSGGSGAPLLFF